MMTFSSVIGTVALVFYTFPYLGILFVPMTVMYYFVSLYYRRSSVETKRMDSLMRSILYGAFSGMLPIFLYYEIRFNGQSRNIDRFGDYSSISRTSKLAALAIISSSLTAVLLYRNALLKMPKEASTWKIAHIT
jgi:RsiW-degrading membrane proteinase PrsW (M82 family)